MAIKIVDLPIQNSDFPWLCDSLPEGMLGFSLRWDVSPLFFEMFLQVFGVGAWSGVRCTVGWQKRLKQERPSGLMPAGFLTTNQGLLVHDHTPFILTFWQHWSCQIFFPIRNVQ